MKKMKKLLALVLVAAMVLAMTVTAFAADGEHTITVTNADQNVVHSYEAYQVFSGTLDSAQQKLTNMKIFIIGGTIPCKKCIHSTIRESLSFDGLNILRASADSHR